MTENEDKYKRRSGVDADHGYKFEWDNTLLWYLMLEKKHQHLKGIEISFKFFVANNVDGVGAFDDVVVRWEYVEESQPKKKLIFIQCKHTIGNQQSEGKLKKYLGLIEMKKYFESFAEIYKKNKNEHCQTSAQNQQAGQNEEEKILQFKNDFKNMFKCDFSDCEFWLLSNIKSEFVRFSHLPHLRKINFNNAGNNMSATYLNLENVYCLEYDKVQGIYENKDLLLKFCESFKICFDQPDDLYDTINCAIKELIIEDAETNFTIKDNLQESLQTETKSILESGTFLTENTDMLKNVKEFLNLKKSFKDLIDNICSSAILCAKESTELTRQLQKFSKTKYERYGRLKIIQILNAFNKRYICIFIKDDKEMENWNLIRKMFKYTSRDKIYVYFEIGIRVPGNKLSNEEFIQQMPDGNDCTLLIDQLTIEDTKLIEEYKIQGFDTNFGNFCTNWRDFLDEDAICDILETKPLVLGNNLPPKPTCYQPRTFRVKELDDETKKEIKRSITEKEGKFLLFSKTVIGIEKIEHSIKWYDSIKAVKKDLTQLKKQKDTTSFLCTYEKENLQLRYTFGNQSKCVVDKIVSEDTLAIGESCSKITILSDIAGMGKSTSMLNIASKYKARNTSHWVLFIELRNYIDKFQQFKNLENGSSAVDFIAKQVLNLDEFRCTLFDNACNKTGKVAIFFDGFDALSSEAAKLFSKLLLALEEATKISNIFVSNRRKCVGTLETYTLQTSINFYSFVAKEIEDCLLSICKQISFERSENIDEYELKTTISKIVSDTEPNSLREILSIPLHIKMFANAHFEKILAYYKNDVDKSDLSEIKFDKLNLYKSFIRAQVIHFFKETLKVNWSTQPDDRKERLIREKIKDIPELVCSIVVPQLPKNDRNDMRDAFATASDDLGLITDDTRSPHSFLHKKIADYLAAKFIVKEFLFRSIDAETEQVFMFVLTNDEYDVLRQFIDEFLGVKKFPKFFESVRIRTPEANGSVTPLHVAAYEGNNNLLKALLRFDETLIDLTNHKRETALHLACLGGNKECVESLLNHNCKINIPDKDGDTAFHFAAEHGEKEIMEILLERDESLLNLQNIYGQTPLYHACRRGKMEAVNLLLSCNCSVNDRDNKGYNAFHNATWHGHIDIMKLLLQRDDTLLNMPNKTGHTSLYIACWEGKTDAALEILSRNCSVNERDCYGDTVFHIAAWRGLVEIMGILIERHDELKSMQNEKLQTPLHYACLENQTEAVNFLLLQGCSVDTLDSHGNTAFHCAAWTNHVETMKILLVHKKSLLDVANICGRTAFHLACKEGKFEAVKFLLTNDCLVNKTDNYGATAFYLAASAKENCCKIMRFLLEKHKTLIDLPNNHGVTPLQHAILQGKICAVKFLLNFGCSTKSRDNDGDTVFHEAAIVNKVEAMKLILQKDNTLLNEQNIKGNTALHHACSRGNEDAVKFLLAHSECSKGLYNCDGNIAFQEAMNKGHTRILELFI